jgi:hypothetical protein
MFTILDGRQGVAVLFWQFLVTHQFIALAKTAINVLLVLKTIDLRTNPAMLKSFRGRGCVQT